MELEERLATLERQSVLTKNHIDKLKARLRKIESVVVIEDDATDLNAFITKKDFDDSFDRLVTFIVDKSNDISEELHNRINSLEEEIEIKLNEPKVSEGDLRIDGIPDRIDEFDRVLEDLKNDVLSVIDSINDLYEDTITLSTDIDHLKALSPKIDELRRNYTNIKIAFRELKEMVWRELKG
jgi:uncharacterized coiled-coil DUF342 family protein